MDVLGYIRVSTEEQARGGLGLDAQRAAIQAEADRRGWTVRWVADEGFSAKDLRRPGIQEALERLEDGGPKVLVVAKLDRLSRSMVDFAGLMARAQRKGWALVALDLGVDMTTPAGELVANVMASVAQWERRVISERTKAAMAEAKRRGVKVGRPRTLPQEVRDRIVSEHETGASLRTIADRLNQDQVPTARGGQWRHSSVQSVLQSEQG